MQKNTQVPMIDPKWETKRWQREYEMVFEFH